MVKKISFEKYSKYTEQDTHEEIMKEINQLQEELETSIDQQEVIKSWTGEGGAKGFKHYLMKEIVANYCQKVSSLNYELFSPEMSGFGSFFANENDKKIAVIKTLLDNHQKLKECGSAPKKDSESDLVEAIRAVYQENSETIDNFIQQLGDELVILNISDKGSRERIQELVKLSRENKTDSPKENDFFQIENLIQENDNLSSQLEKLEVEKERLELLREENLQLKELLRKAEVEIERDAKRQEKQFSKLEETQQKAVSEAEKKTTEALSQLTENKKKLTNLRKEATVKEKEIVSLQNDRERLEGEITEKNEKIENLRSRIKELSQNKKENKELEKQIIELNYQLVEAERLKKQAEAEKKRVLEQMKAAQEALNNLNNELENQREAMNAQMEQLIASWNQIQQKYQKILISLGFSEEEMSGDVEVFLAEILGEKNTGEAATLKDIREISEVNNLQDLIEIVENLKSEIARQKQAENFQKPKGKSTSRRTLSLLVDNKEIKSLQEEMANKEEKLENLTDEELIKRLKAKENEENFSYMVEKKAENNEIIWEKKSLVSDILPLLNNPSDREFGKTAALVIFAPINQLKYLEKLREYQSSDQSELVNRIIQNFYQRLAQQANQAIGEPTPIWEGGFLVKENERLTKELAEKENEVSQLKEVIATSPNLPVEQSHEEEKKTLKSFLQKLTQYLQKDEEDCLEIVNEQKDQDKQEAWKQKSSEYQKERQAVEAFIEVVKNK